MAISPIGQAHPETSVIQVEKIEADRMKTEERPAQQRDDKNSAKVQQENSAREFAEAIERLKRTANVFGWRIHFKLHEDLQEYYVQIIDTETNKVLNEIPSEKILNLVAQIRKLVGLLVNKQA